MNGVTELSLYVMTTGELVGTATASGCEARFADEEQGIATIPGHWSAATHFVQDGAATLRAEMAPTVSAATITADGTDACFIAGLPTPCVVAVSGAVTASPTEVTDGTVTLTATTLGTLRIRVTADPAYKAWETTIHAV
jgi:hypothetical protein